MQPAGDVEAVELVVPAADADLASGLLWAAGVSAVTEEARPDGSVRLLADLPPGGLADVAAATGGRWPARLAVVAEGIDGWRAHAEVVRVGDGVVIRPPWIALPADVPEGAVVVELDPGRAFGHGAHPTTRACLDALVAHPAARVLDVGSGSGVLAVVAAVLGAGEVVAVDVDAEAVAATAGNARRNGVADRVSASGRPLVEVPGRFDLVLANLGAATLRDLAAALRARLAPAGLLVVSGVLEAAWPSVEAALAPLVVEERRVDDGWVTVLLRQPSGQAGSAVR